MRESRGKARRELGFTRSTWSMVAAATVAALGAASAGAAAEDRRETLVVVIDGFRDSSGHARVAVFDAGKGFPDDESSALRKTVVDINGGAVEVRFDGLPPGDYAISLYHDQNDDGRLNKNFLGIPKEGYGVSNNVVHAMRSPTFAEARFRLDDALREVGIHVHY